jgi:hypothetical protein
MINKMTNINGKYQKTPVFIDFVVFWYIPGIYFRYQNTTTPTFMERSKTGASQSKPEQTRIHFQQA